MPAYAHTPNKFGDADLVSSHLKNVANRAAEYAEAFGASSEARLAGLLHDLGKYGALFQKRLAGTERGIDHWSAGAWAALEDYKSHGIASALAIQGHHIGLLRADNDSLRDFDLKRLSKRHPLELRLSEHELSALLQRMKEDSLHLPEIPSSIYDHKTASKMTVAAMLDVRMLFSALVDADFIETEAHFRERNPDGSKQYRETGPQLDAERGFDALSSRLADLAATSTASERVNRVRADLLDGCLESACLPQGLFTLSAPTGSGKTLAMLAFALKHAIQHELKRIIVVLPYLTIIEQTVNEYKKAFGTYLSDTEFEQYVLQDHSLAGTRGDSKRQVEHDDQSDPGGGARLLAQNWDAPIIVTTSVQFLESLFANGPRACRKLHRLAKSVILFDEVQTLPVSLAVVTLAALARLVERYKATVVFATATQPAFSHLDEHVKKYCSLGWQPREIVPPNLRLFERSRRTKIAWPRDFETPLSWDDLADLLAEPCCDQSLSVVNLKRHARTLFEKLKQRGAEGLFHLSTYMCPAHREFVLQQVRERLHNGKPEKRKPCRLVSTQCVEAGVDIDFPVVYRALGPLDAIAQAAGRCNRNGRAAVGTVHIFLPEEEKYPDGTYRQATDVTRILLKQTGVGNMRDSLEPAVFTEYYSQLYDLQKPQNNKDELREAVRIRDFAEVAHLYRVIPQDAINLLVPYDRDIYDELAQEVEMDGLNGKWIARARPYSISLFKPKPTDPISGCLIPVPVGRYATSDEWFIYANKEHYSEQVGLDPPTSLDCLMA